MVCVLEASGPPLGHIFRDHFVHNRCRPTGYWGCNYLSEYAADNRWTNPIRIAIISLAGIPSVTHGLFGLGLFVIFFNFGIIRIPGRVAHPGDHNSPVIITTTEEALRAVPQPFPRGQPLCGSHPIKRSSAAS